jgi:hypothetical protein
MCLNASNERQVCTSKLMLYFSYWSMLICLGKTIWKIIIVIKWKGKKNNPKNDHTASRLIV